MVYLTDIAKYLARREGATPATGAVTATVLKEPAKPGAVLATATVLPPEVAALRDVSYVRRDGSRVTASATRVLATFGLDRDLWRAANEAKKRAHACPRSAGMLAGVLPWTAHYVLCFPLLVCDPVIWKPFCNPHVDEAFPEDLAANALVLTDVGVVARCPPDYAPRAIAWGGFDADKVKARTYDAEKTCFVIPHDASLIYDHILYKDPLSCVCAVGVLGPCAARTCIQPDAPGLYYLRIASIKWEEKKTKSDPVEQLDLVALADPPDVVLAALRAGAAGAPTPAAMAR